jgi:hypothetical protein
VGQNAISQHLNPQLLNNLNCLQNFSGFSST